MTPKEKAKELLDKMYVQTPIRKNDKHLNQDYDTAKQCALIAVDEILNVLWHTHKNEEAWRYYLEVKQKIEKI